MWVLTNLIQLSRDEDRLGMLRTYDSNMVQALCHWLEYNAVKGDARATVEVLKALFKLLELEMKYRDEFVTMEGTVRFMIDEV